MNLRLFQGILHSPTDSGWHCCPLTQYVSPRSAFFRLAPAILDFVINAEAKFAFSKLTPCKFTPRRDAPFKLACERSALSRFAWFRFAPSRFASLRSFPFHCAHCFWQPCQSTPGPGGSSHLASAFDAKPTAATLTTTNLQRNRIGSRYILIPP